MATRIESIVWGAAPDGAIVDHAVLTITGLVTPPQSLDVKMGETSISVDLVPDTYTAVIQAVDAALAPIGVAITDTFTIATPVAYTIPISLSGQTI